MKRPNPTSWIFRNWYPLPYVAYYYKEMAILIPAIWHTDADQWLADLDFRIWHANPTVWLERVYNPVLTEFLQIVYTLFVPAVLLVAFLLWKRGKFAEFQYYAFLIALGYLVSYVATSWSPPADPVFCFEICSTYLAGIVAVPCHAEHPRPAGIGPLRLLSQRPHGTHHPGVVGEPAGIKTVVPGLFGLHSVHHFCYSLSSIPLYGRSAGGEPGGSRC